MIINHTLIIVIAAITALSFATIIFLPFKKKKKYTAGGFTAFFVGIFIFTGIVMLNSRAYIVKGKNDFIYYAVYGQPEYKMSNGTILKLEMPFQKCMIINDSGEELVIEKVIYGYSGKRRPRDIVIKPYEKFTLKTHKLNHIFDDKPPTTIKSEKYGAETHYWLRTRSDYENEYGKMTDSDKLDKLRELLKKKKEK